MIRLTLGTLNLGSATSTPLNIIVDGAGPGGTVIGGGDAFRVMSVSASATVVLDRLQIRSGKAGQPAMAAACSTRASSP